MKGFFIKTRNISVNVTGLENICCVFLGVCVCVYQCMCVYMRAQFSAWKFYVVVGAFTGKTSFLFWIYFTGSLAEFLDCP